MKQTHHSEYGRIKSIYLKPVEEGFVSQQLLSEQWKELNYLGLPDFDQSLQEYLEFESAVKSSGAEVSGPPRDSNKSSFL